MFFELASWMTLSRKGLSPALPRLRLMRVRAVVHGLRNAVGHIERAGGGIRAIDIHRQDLDGGAALGHRGDAAQNRLRHRGAVGGVVRVRLGVARDGDGLEQEAVQAVAQRLEGGIHQAHDDAAVAGRRLKLQLRRRRQVRALRRRPEPAAGPWSSCCPRRRHPDSRRAAGARRPRRPGPGTGGDRR